VDKEEIYLTSDLIERQFWTQALEFKCPKCPRKYKLPANFLDHLRSKHNVRIFKVTREHRYRLIVKFHSPRDRINLDYELKRGIVGGREIVWYEDSYELWIDRQDSYEYSLKWLKEEGFDVKEFGREEVCMTREI